MTPVENLYNYDEQEQIPQDILLISLSPGVIRNISLLIKVALHSDFAKFLAVNKHIVNPSLAHY